MSYYDDTKKYNARGIDYDLHACLEYNGQPEFGVDDIQQVLAVWNGANDEADWRWVVKLGRRKYAFIQGGCDYTGWDCQSWATSAITTTPLKAARFALGEKLTLTGPGPEAGGFGKLISLLGGTYMQDAAEVYQDLVKQIKSRKQETWREKKDKEFGL